MVDAQLVWSTRPCVYPNPTMIFFSGPSQRSIYPPDIPRKHLLVMRVLAKNSFRNPDRAFHPNTSIHVAICAIHTASLGQSLKTTPNSICKSSLVHTRIPRSAIDVACPTSSAIQAMRLACPMPHMRCVDVFQIRVVWVLSVVI